MKKKIDNNRNFIISIFLVLLIMIITVGVSYAIFSYTGTGSIANTITVGNLKFLYTEVDDSGNGISISNALPISDSEGKNLVSSTEVFNFKVEADTSNAALMNYEVTVDKDSSSTLDESVVKIYVTEDGSDAPLTVPAGKVVTYNNLLDTNIINAKGKVVYRGTVPSDTANYLKEFQLRMWIDEMADFGDQTKDYNNKSFSVKVNVYADSSRLIDKSTIAYNTGDFVTLSDNSTWTVVANSSSSNSDVLLLSNKLIDNEGNYIDNCVDNSCYYAFDTTGQTTIDKNTVTNIGYILENKYLPKLMTSLLGGNLATLEVRLLEDTEFAGLMLASFDGTSTANYTVPAIYKSYNNNSFWLQTSRLISDINYVSAVNSTTSQITIENLATVNDTYGIRPVILIDKTNIK